MNLAPLVPGVDAELKPTVGLVVYNVFIQVSPDRKQASALTGMHERSARKLLISLKEEGLLSKRDLHLAYLIWVKFYPDQVGNSSCLLESFFTCNAPRDRERSSP